MQNRRLNIQQKSMFMDASLFHQTSQGRVYEIIPKSIVEVDRMVVWNDFERIHFARG